MIPNYEPQLRPTYPQATTNPNYDQLRPTTTKTDTPQKRCNCDELPNYEPQLRPTTPATPPSNYDGTPPKGGASCSWDGSRRCRKKQIKAKQPKTGRPERRIQHEKKPLVTQTITACPGQTRHPKSTITTATHTGQAAPSGIPTCKPHRHRHRPSGTHPRRTGPSKPASNLI